MPSTRRCPPVRSGRWPPMRSGGSSRCREGGVLIESVWLAGRDEEWFRRGWEAAGSPAGVEVWCEAPRDVMRERYLTRARHAVHDDGGRLPEWESAADAARPMTGFPVIRVDTTGPVDIAALATTIKEQTWTT